jgi:hypothetical protein
MFDTDYLRKPGSKGGCCVDLEVFLGHCVYTLPSSDFIARLVPSAFAASSSRSV